MFDKAIYGYKNILIDTDCEVDDKAALQIFFRSLAQYKLTNPSYSYPNITIVAGSSRTPAVKVAVVKAIIADLRKNGFVPEDALIKVVKGSPTDREHPNDGQEWLSKDELKSLLEKEDPSTLSAEALKTIEEFLQNEKKEESAYIGLR